MIIFRYTHFLDIISTAYEMHFEFIFNMNIYVHCIINMCENEKDLKIKSKRFFLIKADNRGFIDVRPIIDLLAFLLYLTNKTEKKYQITGIPPIIKKSID